MRRLKPLFFGLLSKKETLFLLLTTACLPSTTPGNKLKYEKGPYLLQHKDNPVWWQPWGEEALAMARKKDKPIFLSIGYSTCHWCHVMEKETFESVSVAKFLNENFISIKVDREERPDIDKIYMEAVQVMGVRGGWPLSVVLTPDLAPFWGGTYFPKDHFMKIMENIKNLWDNVEEREKVKSRGVAIVEFLKKHSPKPHHQGSKTFETAYETIYESAYKELQESFDERFGGFGRAPKFPPTMKLRLLMRMAAREENPERKGHMVKMAETTLIQMFKGGIYDHIGGGFHRYSVDDKWLAPHFEKMLYDNALLAMTYIEAYQLQLAPKELFAQVARETLDYVLLNMSDSEGGLHSAEDADSEGVEGLFYLWSFDEIKGHLSKEEFRLAQEIYAIVPKGNFEKKHILNLIHHKDNRVLETVFGPKIRAVRKKLHGIREKRIHPHKDDKVITAWNALMVTALAKGFQTFGEEKYLKAALKAAHFIKDKLDKGHHQLKRRYRGGEARFDAYLDDYAYLIEALLTLYESDFNTDWITWAQDLQKRQDKNLWVPSLGAYRFARESKDLIKETVDFNDSARPNSNAVSLLNLLRFYSFTYDDAYRDKAQLLIKAFEPYWKRYPLNLAQGLIALDFQRNHPKEIVILGDRKDPVAQRMIEMIQTNFYPNKALALASAKADETLSAIIPLFKNKTRLSGKLTAYVCQNKVCYPPVNTVEDFKSQLERR